MKSAKAIGPKPSPKSKSASPNTLICLGVAAIVFITIIAYLPAMQGGFIWDDDQYVSENLLLQNVSGIGKIWALGRMATLDHRTHLVSYTPQYYPLVFSTFWLESRLWGNQNPTGFHVVNVLLHIANALLLWLICHRLGFAWGFFAGAIFALHPVEVESVAWITERKNVLSGLFYMLALLSYLRFDKSSRKLFYFTALGCFILALLSKTITCSLPVILLGILWLRHRRLSWADLYRLIPFFVVGVIFGLFTAYLERYRVGAVGAEWEIAFWQRCVIAGRAVFFYAWKLLWPAKLTFIYPRWNPDEFSLLGLLWPVAAIALTVFLWSRRKAIGWAPLIAWAGFVITLFPALGFIDVYPFRYSFVADHWQYLASIFCITLFVGLGYSLYHRLCSRGLKFLALPSVQVLLSSILLLLLGCLTYAQAHMYQNIEELWKTTIRRNPKAPMAWINLGLVHDNQGKHDQAILDYNQAIKLNPTEAKGHYNRGSVYLAMRDYKQAIRDLSRAIELKSNYFDAFYNRANAYLAMGDYNRAIHDYSEAIRLNPKLVQAYNNRAGAYANKGQHDLAIRDFSQAIKLDPQNAEAHNNRGLTYLSKGQPDQAFRDYSQAIKLDPSYANAYYNRGTAYLSKGELDQALRDLSRAIELNPNEARPYNNRAIVHSKKAQHTLAIRDFEKAIQLARASGDKKLAKDLQENLDRYKAKYPKSF